MADTLGKRNPFRYRGYVLDEESGLYYLRSRYYNPRLQRFISADISILPDKDLRNSNMYAYCRNTPVIGVDSYGTSWWNSCVKWFSDNIVDPIVDGATKLINSIDMTFTIGFSGSVTVGCWTYSASIGLSVDTKGGIGVQGSVSASLGTNIELDATGSVFVTVTNAPTIAALEEDSTQIGMSIEGGLYRGAAIKCFLTLLLVRIPVTLSQLAFPLLR